MLMELDEEAIEESRQLEEGPPMPGMSTDDPLTYDPTQGAGTDAWQEAVRKQRELNARLSLEQQAKVRRN